MSSHMGNHQHVNIATQLLHLSAVSVNGVPTLKNVMALQSHASNANKSVPLTDRMKIKRLTANCYVGFVLCHISGPWLRQNSQMQKEEHI